MAFRAAGAGPGEGAGAVPTDWKAVQNAVARAPAEAATPEFNNASILSTVGNALQPAITAASTSVKRVVVIDVTC